MTGTRFEDVVAAVSEAVTPAAEEAERLDRAAATLLERAREAVAERGLEADVLQVGSTARDTWISGDRDIDIFVRFPPDLPRSDLERHGLAIGHAVLPTGREEYAEHPYVTGTFEGFAVDLVPCYGVESAREGRSAVDRTPFHTAYIEARLTDELAAEVRVFKQLLKGIGVYGSDLRTRGFSGYLTELLVLEYGGVRATLEAAADWHPPVRLDPAGHGERSFDDPLVVIDPTDPTRNVAAVLAADNLARLQHYARDALAAPRSELFVSEPRDPLSPAAVREHVAARGTTPLALVFEAPDVVEDQLYPQLRKSLAGIADELDRRGFDVFRRTTFADDRAVLLVELAAAERPIVERHEGPPVHVREHAERFYRAYADADVYGPFIDGDRYVVERERAFRTATELLESDAVFEMRLGPNVAAAMRDGYDVLAGADTAALAEDFGRELAAYFDPRP